MRISTKDTALGWRGPVTCQVGPCDLFPVMHNSLGYLVQRNMTRVMGEEDNF